MSISDNYPNCPNYPQIGFATCHNLKLILASLLFLGIPSYVLPRNYPDTAHICLRIFRVARIFPLHTIQLRVSRQLPLKFPAIFSLSSEFTQGTCCTIERTLLFCHVLLLRSGYFCYNYNNYILFCIFYSILKYS